MHPILTHGGRLALYLGIWLLVGGLLAALVVGQVALSGPQALLIALPLASVYAFVCLSAWYLARSLPLGTTGALRVVATAVIAAVISSAAWLLAAGLWLGWLTARGVLPPAIQEPAALTPLFFGFGVLLYLLSLAVSYLLVTFEETREAERRALEVQVRAREAELRSLRAQIDPHFLFNSLHSISALTGSDPAAARRMCLLLAEFLRESIGLGGQGRIPLARELGLAERFLEIERVRFGRRLTVAISPGDAGTCLVPPLLLQPIVENAVTHGVAHVLEGGIIGLTASRTSATLSIVVENPCDPDRPRGTGTGVGLANVRARLHALYGHDGWLSAAEQDGTWRVEITLPAMPEAGRQTGAAGASSAVPPYAYEREGIAANRDRG